MSKIVYLLGGAGNVFFQMLQVAKKDESVLLCDFFIRPSVRKFFGHTDHKEVYKEIFVEKKTNFFHFSILFLLFDMVLARFFGFTLFSVIDVKRLKGRPIFREYIYFGYFQSGVEISEIYNFKSVVVKNIRLKEKKEKCVMHVRGGDFIKSNSHLESEYYEACIKHVCENVSPLDIVVVTNDVAFSKNLISKISYKFNFTIQKNTEAEDFEVINSSEILICSNSTFALAAGLTGNYIKRLYLPVEMKEKFLFNNDVKGVEICFE